MSKAVGRTYLPKIIQVCAMCKKDEVMAHTFVDYSKIRICSLCYDSIPDHIPLQQDSEYVLAFIKRKENDGIKR